MKASKKILIVTDGDEETGKLAVAVAKAIAGALEGGEVVYRTAREFAGTDILPAEVYFFGCRKPAPPAFAYLAELLRHINLAGRPCGVFSPLSPDSRKAAAYLADILRDSEVLLNPRPLYAADPGDLQNWVKKILALEVKYGAKD